MQKAILILAGIALSAAVNAQTIALHSSTGVQIIKGNTALVDAYAAAQDGDTLYLSGNTFTPPAAFDKHIVIIGAGHYVDSTLATGKTFINGNIVLQENADMFYLEGVEISGGVIFTDNHSINNVVIKRCKLNNQLTATGNLSNPSSNLSLIGNVFLQHISFDNIQTSIISNNIIGRTFLNSNGNLVSNNIVLGYVFGSSVDYLFVGSNNTLNNNIFIWEGYTANPNGTGNVFNNNIYVEPTPSYGTNATAIGNYPGVAQAAIFVDQTGAVFSYDHDYHLQDPATYLGTDNTEVGIYGGSFPYKEGAVPQNPHIQFKNIAPTTDANGDLQIQIQVEAQEN